MEDKKLLNKKRKHESSKTGFNKNRSKPHKNENQIKDKISSNFINARPVNNSVKFKKNYSKDNKSKFNPTDSKSKAREMISYSLDYFNKARTLYENYSSEYDIEKNKFKNSEFKWVAKMIEKGTYEDKLSALIQHIKKSPKQTLNYLAEISEHLNSKNNRHILITYEALKDVFLNVILENKKYSNFIDYIAAYKQSLQAGKDKEGNNQDNNPIDSNIVPNNILIEAYVSDTIHKLYFQFILSLENYLKEDNVVQIKKQILSIIQELLCKKPEREDYLIDLLIYKLGDPRPELSSQAMMLIKNLQETHISMSLVVLKRLNSFISNANVATEDGIFHALALISQLRLFKNEEYVKYGLNMYFKLFNEYVQSEEERYTKFLEQIIKGISYFYKCALLIHQNNVSRFYIVYYLVTRV